MTQPFLNLVKDVGKKALASGALKKFCSKHIAIIDNNFEFEITCLESLHAKNNISNRPKKEFQNPFLPYESSLYVCDLGEGHVCLLNKFNVVDDHVLTVTKEFFHQSSPLNEGDLQAWYTTVQNLNGIGFFNCGLDSGASQPHKHMQTIPASHAFLDVVISGKKADNQTIHTCEDFDFNHAFVRFMDRPFADGELKSIYDRLLSSVGIALPTTDNEGKEDIYAYPLGFPSYNLILTEKMFFIVPRKRSGLLDDKGIHLSVNALGFAGLLLIKSNEQAHFIKSYLPLNILKEVSMTPRS